MIERSDKYTKEGWVNIASLLCVLNEHAKLSVCYKNQFDGVNQEEDEVGESVNNINGVLRNQTGGGEGRLKSFKTGSYGGGWYFWESQSYLSNTKHLGVVIVSNTDPCPDLVIEGGGEGRIVCWSEVGSVIRLRLQGLDSWGYEDIVKAGGFRASRQVRGIERGEEVRGIEKVEGEEEVRDGEMVEGGEEGIRERKGSKTCVVG